MLSPLLERAQNKELSEKDIPLIRDRCLERYGYDWWNSVGLDELFEQLPIIFDEYNKKESMRLNTLKYYGVKNPK